MELTAPEGRVLGALVEKERTTPQGYPLTENALLAACNQTTSRDPVVSYDVPTVRLAVRGRSWVVVAISSLPRRPCGG